jgi:hypothetical protein
MRRRDLIPLISGTAAADRDALTRRSFVQGAAASSLALAAFTRTAAAQGAKPNIVFILADDLAMPT